MARRTYLYRLLVTWPDPDDGTQYEWSKPHLYLSRAGANERAVKMRAAGAIVDVERSLPVDWGAPGSPEGCGAVDDLYECTETRPHRIHIARAGDPVRGEIVHAWDVGRG